jgi:hypothetical protein
VGVGGDQQHPGQPAGDEVGEERVPGPTGLRRGDLDPEDLAVAVEIDPGRDQDDGVDDPTASRTFIVTASAATKVNGPDSANERVRNAVTCSSRSAAIRETCDFDKLVMPRDWASLSIRRVDTPSR